MWISICLKRLKMDSELIKKNERILRKSDARLENESIKKKSIRMTKKSKIFFSSRLTKNFPVLDDPNGLKILFWRAKGSSKRINKMEINLARYFMSKGMKTEFVLCRGTLAGCISHNIFLDDCDENNINQWYKTCSQCYYSGKTFFRRNNIVCRDMNEWITFNDRLKYKCLADEISVNQIEDYCVNGIPVGDIAITGVFRYFRSLETGRDVKKINADSYLQRVVREYFYSSLVSTHVAQKSIENIKPDRLFMIRGVYPLWGPAVYAAVLRDIPVLYWSYGYDKDKIFARIVTKDDFEQLHAPQKKHWSIIKDKKLTDEENLRIDKFMTDRINSLSHGRISYGNSFPSVGQLRKTLGINENKKVWMINSHCNWDWDIYIENKVFFRDPIEWLLKTFDIIRHKTDIEWIIRTHPAENKRNTKLLCRDIILRKFKNIPSHIRIITSDSDINTYSILPLVEGCITMQSTVGLEMALFGKPVILGDYGFYGNKGFTYNPKTLQEYTNLLNNINSIGPLTQDQINMARRYVYDFWFYRQIPLRNAKYCNILSNDSLYKMIYKRLQDLNQIGWDPVPLGKVENPEQYNWRKRLIERWKS